MSTERDITGAMEHYGDVPRQHSRCKVIVHSHITSNDKKGTIDCSADVTECQTSKTIKGGGNAVFTLVPRRNYLNYIFPNDWINIWFDPGDGRGFIRTFFGFVDRVERSIATDSGTGATTTLYTVTCSDFTKAFDATQIYFNPHVADRDDFVGQFAGARNLAGATLRMKGVTVYGTPADIVLNMATILLGFHSQFQAPPTYPIDDQAVQASRKLLAKWLRQRMPTELQKVIGKSTITVWAEGVREAADQLAETWRETGVTDLDGNPLPVTYNPNNPQALDTLAQEFILTQLGLPPNTLNSSDIVIGEKMEAVMGTANRSACLFDMLDFSFVEYLAIDGSIVSAPIWTQQGTLWSLMNAYSNPVVNELFCDLRPLSDGYLEGNPIKDGGYAIETDNIVNMSKVGEHGEQMDPSIRMVPALIMREYPFSLIETIDASHIKLLDSRLGEVYIGNVFHKNPGKTGRAVSDIKVLHDYIADMQPETTARKHLDVFAISTTDIISESIGRGDHDIANLVELYSDGPMGKHMKFLTNTIQPIASPISVARHGLRVRTYSTRFARFSKKQHRFAGVDNAGTRTKLIRWALMVDHWYQHNIEYLNGTITTRAFPEVRVGYRLDIRDRNESYYVEGVNQQWRYPETMLTTFTLSRGQRNDNFPIYVKPQVPGMFGLRDDQGRLAEIFRVLDPPAVLRNAEATLTTGGVNDYTNEIDDPEYNTWGSKTEGYIAAGQGEAKLTEGLDSIKTKEEFEKHRQFSERVTSLDYDVTGKFNRPSELRLDTDTELIYSSDVSPTMGSIKK